MALTGMDIASYQASLDVRNVGGDFVIIKATEGTRYVNPYCDKHYQQAKAAGKLRGVYHFARNRTNSAAAEAKHFVDNIRGYIRDAVLVLDWEDGSGVSDVAWAKTWLDTVTQMTGVRPLIYMSASPASQYAWETVARDYGLWVAGYPTSAARGLEAPDCPYRPGHGWNLVMWQYTSSGRINGYGGNLDLNVFYGDKAAWARYAGSTSTVATATTTSTSASAVVDRALDARTGTDGARQLAITGVLGSPTLRRLQEVMGTQIGGPAAPAYAALQRFLNGQLSSGAKRTLTGSTTLAADGTMGWRSWKCLQYWSAHANPSWMRQAGGPADLNGGNFSKWVTGRGDAPTVRMLQHILNSSYAGSGKLLSK
ncbi:GH25 family lysozyme [Actinomyces procaprae]|uniref:GH25 family lysozyme n=1 Tax=Actinomyces procaprae TaxID=2560010 RepID=UPI0010A21865|nr:GH25 family lysozyme [Actinomyces procaprae]